MDSVHNSYDIMDHEDVTSESLTEFLMLGAADFIRYSVSWFCHNPSGQHRGYLKTTRKTKIYQKRQECW